MEGYSLFRLSIREGITQEGLILEGNVWRELSGGNVLLGSLFWVGNVRGGSCPAGNCPSGGVVQGGTVRGELSGVNLPRTVQSSVQCT